MHKNTATFVEFCEQRLDLDNILIENKYKSISLCVIDCVYSLRAQYETTTKRVVERYVEKFMNGDVDASDDNLADLISNIEKAGGPELFAANVLKNNQKSGGILKAEICLNLALNLQYLHINTLDDFLGFEAPELLEVVIRSVKGMGDAGSNYLFMLAGDPNRCKPDIHVHRFVREACGIDLPNDEIQQLFTDAVDILVSTYPGLTVAMLDGFIWRKYQIANKSE